MKINVDDMTIMLSSKIMMNITHHISLQIQVLVDDSNRLQETYPGENAEQIETLQATVIDNWGILQDRAAARKDELLAALDLHR